MSVFAFGLLTLITVGMQGDEDLDCAVHKLALKFAHSLQPERDLSVRLPIFSPISALVFYSKNEETTTPRPYKKEPEDGE